ncbi:thiamine pyrophosphate-dependent enzyme [Rhizobium leguminosarum]|uniref:thiamine pyrophosphate-dependent enzyme n=1 Tax=Rhizobium leguminosarum TaxID=384 RepID=UPI0021BBE121
MSLRKISRPKNAKSSDDCAAQVRTADSKRCDPRSRRPPHHRSQTSTSDVRAAASRLRSKRSRSLRFATGSKSKGIDMTQKPRKNRSTEGEKRMVKGSDLPHQFGLPIASDVTLDHIAALIPAAKRPLLMFGAAASRAVASRPGLAADMAQFVIRTGIPFLTSQMGKGTVPENSHLYMGTPGLSEGEHVHEIIDKADLIMMIGHYTTEKPPFIMRPKGQTVIHIADLRAAFEPVYFPQFEVIGEIGHSLKALADRLNGKLPNADALLPLREEIPSRRSDRADEKSWQITPQRLVHDVRKVMPKNGIVALDNGRYKIDFARNYRTYLPNTLLLDNCFATMGAGLPSAITAAMLNPELRVMAVCGDGGFLMTCSEIETARRLKVNLVVIIVVDNAYGMISWKQASKGFPNFGTDFSNPDFVKLAEAFYAKGTRVETPDDLVPALEAAFEGGGIHVVEVAIVYSDYKRVLTDKPRSRKTKPTKRLSDPG